MSELTWADRHVQAQTALLLNETIVNASIHPSWIDDTNVWYERRGDDGFEYRVVDATSAERRTLATRSAIAKALAAHLDVEIDPEKLIIANPRFDLKRDTMTFSAFGDPYEYSLEDCSLRRAARPVDDANWVMSPDGLSALIGRDGNLLVLDPADGSERLLTTDGSTFNSYATPPAAQHGMRARVGNAVAEALWSPDGKWILTQQTDDRHVPDLAVADYAPDEGGRPKLVTNRVSLPSDTKVTEFRMVAVEVASGRQTEARYPRLPAVRMNSSPVGANLAWWSADSTIAYFIDIERGEQAVHVVAFDRETGDTNVLFTERSDTYVEVSPDVYTHALIAPLGETRELVWYSERDGNGHLYLYDLATGALKNAITAGPWRVREILSVDPIRREVVFLAGGIAPDETPYIVKPCIASLDGGPTRILSDAPGNHIVRRAGELTSMLKRLEGFDPRSINGFSPSGDYFVESVGSLNELPRTWLRRRDGSEIALLETASGSFPAGWHAPELIRFKAADGITDTFGVLFKPIGFDPNRRYPLIDYIYGGPQTSNVPHGGYAASGAADLAFQEGFHLAALGAFVLILDGRGTALREQSFRTASWRAAHTASNLEDHVAAIGQLAELQPQIDLDRVGITGFSGGGYMTAHAALRFGDTFKVAVAGGGNYDQALFWHSWGERYHGKYAADHYADQSASTYADGLTGKLMLVHGLRDEGCHPAALFQLVQSLIDANKDFDLVVLPQAGHSWTGYGLRRRWDYFISHLIGETPPPSKPFSDMLDGLFERIKSNVSSPKSDAATQQ